MPKADVNIVKRDVDMFFDRDALACVVSGQEDDAWFNGAVPGEMLRIRVRGGEVGGQYTILESIVQPMAGPPLHTHREDEVFLVLEGTLTLQAAGERIEAGPGGLVSIPAGVVHAWCNFTDKPVRFFATFMPGGIEELFELLQFTPPEQLPDVAARYGTIVAGPPLDR